jgi:RimJ/RimL family protein N-acetyltransferase
VGAAVLGAGRRARRDAGRARCATLRRIISTAAPDNHASRHVMEKIGLTYRGTHVISGAEIWYAIDSTG